MMTPPNLRAATVWALALAASVGSVSCSSSAGGGEAPPASADGGVTVDTLTLPCSINTGYPGDDLCIQAPDPKQGFQFHFGPKDYTDPNEVAKYLLQPGEEKTECVFLPSVNTETVYLQEYHSRLRPGSHHLLNYVQPSSSAPRTSTAPEACNQTMNFRMLLGATSAKLDVTRASPGVENDGVALQLGPKQQVVLQLHVINASASPILREAWANFRYADKTTVTELADPVQFMGGFFSSIPVGETVINSGTAVVPSNAAPDFRLLGAIPHFHAHTTDFKVYATRSGVRQLILEQFGTLDKPYEPFAVEYDSAVQNSMPDEVNRVPGAFTGILHLAPGDTIDWQCTQTNDGIGANGTTFTTPLAFTEEVYTGEMCNLFGVYAPTTGSSWDAIGLGQTIVSQN